MHPTRIDIPLKTREQLALILNERLADLLDLQLQAKQAHWNFKGPQFMALHQLFDAVAEAVEEFVDTVAERIVTLGGTAEGTVKAVSSRSKLAAYPEHITSGRDHVAALAAALATVAKTIRDAIDNATELADAGTADLFTEVSRGLDKHLWFVEAHLQSEI